MLVPRNCCTANFDKWNITHSLPGKSKKASVATERRPTNSGSGYLGLNIGTPQLFTLYINNIPIHPHTHPFPYTNFPSKILSSTPLSIYSCSTTSKFSASLLKSLSGSWPGWNMPPAPPAPGFIWAICCAIWDAAVSLISGGYGGEGGWREEGEGRVGDEGRGRG